MAVALSDGYAASPRHIKATSSAAAGPAAVDVMEAPRVAPLAPARVSIPSTSPVVQIACGQHHTVVLTYAGECFTFGSNQYGQLGSGDLQSHAGPVQVHGTAQGSVLQVAAGGNHTVLLTGRGDVLTFGAHAKGQLGRGQAEWLAAATAEATAAAAGTVVGADAESGGGDKVQAAPADDASALNRQKFLWHCAPSIVAGLGPQFGKKVTWIGASGDQTFFKIDESLITGSMLSKVSVVADKQTIRKWRLCGVWNIVLHWFKAVCIFFLKGRK